MPWRFPQIFSRPGTGVLLLQANSVGEDHKEHEALIHAVQSGMDSLVGSTGSTADMVADAVTLSKLQGDIRKFGKEVREHMDNEEHFYSTPITRKVRRL